MDYWMVPLKTMNVIPRRIALNVEVIGDVRNAMVVVTWIAMCAMAMDSAGKMDSRSGTNRCNVMAQSAKENPCESRPVKICLARPIQKPWQLPGTPYPKIRAHSARALSCPFRFHHVLQGSPPYQL